MHERGNSTLKQMEKDGLLRIICATADPPDSETISDIKEPEIRDFKPSRIAY